MPGEATTYRPTAVLIRGNPNVGKGGPYARFYRKLNEELAMQGFDVTEDAGEAWTLPKPADLWLGFSRGAGRLQYAPEGVRTLPVGSKVEGAINHPDDDVHTPWHLVGRSPPAAHAKIPPGLREKLREIATLIAEERQNKLAVDPSAMNQIQSEYKARTSNGWKSSWDPLWEGTDHIPTKLEHAREMLKRKLLNTLLLRDGGVLFKQKFDRRGELVNKTSASPLRGKVSELATRMKLFLDACFKS